MVKKKITLNSFLIFGINNFKTYKRIRFIISGDGDYWGAVQYYTNMYYLVRYGGSKSLIYWSDKEYFVESKVWSLHKFKICMPAEEFIKKYG